MSSAYTELMKLLSNPHPIISNQKTNSKIVGECKYCKSSIWVNQKACESCGASI